MWQIVILTVMISLTGYYSLIDQKIVPNAQDANARNLATSMGVYRQAVVNYSSDTAHRTKVGVVDPSEKFPAGYTAASAAFWNNYIEADGTIYVFPAAPLPVNITSEIVALSQNSILAGESNSTRDALIAPADIATPSKWENNEKDIPLAKDYLGSTPIPLPLAAAIPSNSPVWLAHRN